MENIIQDVVKKQLLKWFCPTEAEWVAAFQQTGAFSDYKWGVLWVNRNYAALCGFFAWKAWIMNMGLLFGGLYIFTAIFGKL